MGAFTFTIPDYHPPLLNAVRGRHWAAGEKAKKELDAFLAVYAVRADPPVPKAAGRRRVRLRLTGWGRGGAFPDRDWRRDD